MTYDLIIIGAGAAGLMCAIEAGKRALTVLVIEHEEKTGKKILISGGGRCNFTNRSVTSDNFISNNPHFCKSALANFTPDDFISLVSSYNIPYHEKKLGQLFCDGSSREIVSLLEDECKKSDVKILTKTSVTNIEKNDKFKIQTSNDLYQSDSLVISSGGISIPKMGATNFGYKVAEQFSIRLTDIRPALVPFILNKNDQPVYSELSGIAIPSSVSCNDVTFDENILFTHKGLSVPAILQISSYWKEGDAISINLLPAIDFPEMLIQNSKNRTDLINYISAFLPKRFAEVFCKANFILKQLNQYSHRDLRSIGQKFHRWEMFPETTEGYAKAEVTLGGIDTDELSSKTMESKKVKGLYFIGEVVDVTGWLGGYNFQWAWSSGYAAGRAIINYEL